MEGTALLLQLFRVVFNHLHKGTNEQEQTKEISIGNMQTKRDCMEGKCGSLHPYPGPAARACMQRS